MSIDEKIAKGAGLFHQWRFPWVDGLRFDEAHSQLELRLGPIVVIRLSARNGGLLIERPEAETLTVTAMLNTNGLPVGEYDYDVRVLLIDGTEFLSESGKLTVAEEKKVGDRLPVIGSIRPWSAAYPHAIAGGLDDQEAFEAELEAALNAD